MIRKQNLFSGLMAAAVIALAQPVWAGCGSCGSCGSKKHDKKSDHTHVKAETKADHKHADSPDIVDTAVKAGQFKTLVAAVKAADLVETLKGEGPFTVFAPSDDAFAKLPEGTLKELLKKENKATLQAILTYHVVPGRLNAKHVVKQSHLQTVNGQRVDLAVDKKGAKIDGANIVATDIQTSNGVIHVIDRVILPNTNDIPATAAKAGKFKTLLAAAKAAGLVEALQSKGPLTVFAPTDDAFAALPEGTVESLLKKENRGKLQAILKYHVVPARVYSDAITKKGVAVKTLEGSKVTAKLSGKAAMINDATVVAADIDAANGVIHVIDRVLIPTPKEARADDSEQTASAATK